METIAWLLSIIGLLAGLGGAFWLAFLALDESVLWGICCVLIPFAAVVFALLHWPKTRNPVLLYIGGVGVFILGKVLSAWA